MNSFYITTPIYYVNDVPHLGTAYCTIAADVLARFERLIGQDVYFLTGTDEHGEKIQQAAEKQGVSPQAFTDEVSKKFSDAWEKLKITHDDFIRTTEPRHREVVEHFLKTSLAKGDIYLSEYEGWYCVSEETFYTESQLVNGKTPDGKEVKKVKEENFFFKLGKYVPALVEHIKSNPDFLLPESKRNEVLSFLTEDIRDISISRTTFDWGIPFPQTLSQKKHVVYVWFDALTNYVSALGKNHFEKYWGSEKTPKAVHLVGKDILRFHAVYWPAFLMSVGLPLPKRVFAHGWWTIEGQKMSKSLGNTVEPVAFTEQYGQDSFRLFLFREFPMGQDGDFSLKNFKERANADLANNLGNLVSRTLNLIQKNRSGIIFDEGVADFKGDGALEQIAKEYESIIADFILPQGKEATAMEKFEYHKYLHRIFQTLSLTNKYVEEKAPWHLAKDPSKTAELTQVLNGAGESIRLAALLLSPFIPTSSIEIIRRLGQNETQTILEKLETAKPGASIGSEILNKLKWNQGKKATVDVAQPLFMRLT